MTSNNEVRGYDDKHRHTTVSPIRHLVKAVTYRVLGSLVTFVTGWYLTGNAGTGFTIGTADFIGKIALYYIHERLWYRFSHLGVHDVSVPTRPSE